MNGIDDKEFNYLISMLQIYGYMVRFNNHNIGSIWNLTVYKYVKRKWFFKELYDLKVVGSVQINMPDEFTNVIEILKSTLVAQTTNYM